MKVKLSLGLGLGHANLAKKIRSLSNFVCQLAGNECPKFDLNPDPGAVTSALPGKQNNLMSKTERLA